MPKKPTKARARALTCIWSDCPTDGAQAPTPAAATCPLCQQRAKAERAKSRAPKAALANTNAEQQLKLWQRLYPQGTPVRFWRAGNELSEDGQLGVTASEAALNVNGTPCVLVRAAATVGPLFDVPLDRALPCSIAHMPPEGAIVPGVWVRPARGASRFKTREEAQRCALALTSYGPGVYEAVVCEEPSSSRPNARAFQVYIRSVGAMEGLVKYQLGAVLPEGLVTP